MQQYDASTQGLMVVDAKADLAPPRAASPKTSAAVGSVAQAMDFVKSTTQDLGTWCSIVAAIRVAGTEAGASSATDPSSSISSPRRPDPSHEAHSQS